MYLSSALTHLPTACYVICLFIAEKLFLVKKYKRDNKLDTSDFRYKRENKLDTSDFRYKREQCK